MVGVENNILICDTLIIEGVKWLVPHWTEAPAEGWKKPTRMIRPNQDWFDDLGDDNHFRDQGQIILHGNTITDSEFFGINIHAGLRDGPEGTPHAGAVRALLELNDEHLAPGVTVTNNLVVAGGQGGIRFAGDPNPPGVAPSAVPFGRILNNTVVGNTAADGQS